MARESIEEKALRYIVEGRLNILRVDPASGQADAEARGSMKEPYQITLRSGVWSCDCPATLRCAHLVAVALMVRPVHHAPAFGSDALDEFFLGESEKVSDEDPFVGL